MSREWWVGFLLGTAALFLVGALFSTDSSWRWAIAMGLGLGLLAIAPIWWWALAPRPVTVGVRFLGDPLAAISIPSPAWGPNMSYPNTVGIGRGMELFCEGDGSIDVTRIVIWPSVRLSDGSSWGHLFALSVPPHRDYWGHDGAWTHQWNEEAQDVYALTGLPITLKGGQTLQLPVVTVRVDDHAAVRTTLDSGLLATLNLRFSMDTSIQRFTPEINLPVEVQEPPDNMAVSPGTIVDLDDGSEHKPPITPDTPSPTSIEHEGVVWEWGGGFYHGGGLSSDGPFCPDDRVRLFYRDRVNGAEWRASDGDRIGGPFGELFCPGCRRTFIFSSSHPVQGVVGKTVGQCRTEAEMRLEALYPKMMQ